MINLFLALFMMLTVVPAQAQAFTTVEWDRNADADAVDHYECYICPTKNCSPLVGGTRYGIDVPQPPSTTLRVQMTMPSAPPQGRVSVIAVDVFGNKSGESNIVSFRQTPIMAPKGVGIK